VFREARAAGLVTGYVSNGNATPQVLEYLRPWVDLYKVDLKSFDDRRYHELGGRLQPILDSIERIHNMGFWLEVVTLVVPGFNDSSAELEALAGFLAGISPDIPWHVTAFYPTYKMTGPGATTAGTLERAASIGRAAGLRYVYAGNLPGSVGGLENTHCPNCRAVLVERDGKDVMLQITPLKNNYNGTTPDPSYISGWNLTLDGLASGLSISLDIRNLLTRFSSHEQITRLVCVEGWSAVAWWSGLRFDDLLHAYPPMSQAKWARVESAVNLDASGNPDPYFVSLDLLTTRHPQTLLATHFNGQPLTVEHGAPLRLLVPVKLGLKNVKAITKISYVAEEPKDYWAERGYSRYDGI